MKLTLEQFKEIYELAKATGACNQAIICAEQAIKDENLIEAQRIINHWSQWLASENIVHLTDDTYGTNVYCVGCTDCKHCVMCSNCTDCTRCTNCTDCTRCTNCTDCAYCTNCTDCAYCTNCTRCTDCAYCTNCTRCTNCTDCTSCRNYLNNKVNAS